MNVLACTRPTVADAMVTDVRRSPADVTAGALRALFDRPKVQSAVLLDGSRLVAVVDPADLVGAADSVLAAGLGMLGDRVAHPGEDLDAAWERLLTSGRRRLAVTGDDGRFLGLLCLKRTLAGFCSDDDVRARSRERAPGPSTG